MTCWACAVAQRVFGACAVDRATRAHAAAPHKVCVAAERVLGALSQNASWVHPVVPRAPKACASARGARLRCARPASTSLAVASCAICHGGPHGSAAVCCAFLIPKRSIFDVWSKYPNCAPRWGAVSLCIDERLTTSQIVSVQSCVHPCGGRLDGFTASLRLRESLGFVRAGVDVRRAMRVF